MDKIRMGALTGRRFTALAVLVLALLALAGCSRSRSLAPDHIVLPVEMGGVAIDLPFNQRTLVTLRGRDQSLYGGQDMAEAISLVSKEQRLPVSGVSFSFSGTTDKVCTGPNSVVEACNYARHRAGIRVGIIKIYVPEKGSKALSPTRTVGHPASDGALTATEMPGDRVAFTSLTDGRVYEAQCLRVSRASGLDYICNYLATDGAWNWTSQINVAEAGLPMLVETMVWVDEFVQGIKSSGRPL